MNGGWREVRNIGIDFLVIISLTLIRYSEWPSIQQFWRAQCVPFEVVFGKLDLEFQHRLRVLHHSGQAEQLDLIHKGNRDADEERQRIKRKEKGKLSCESASSLAKL